MIVISRRKLIVLNNQTREKLGSLETLTLKVTGASRDPSVGGTWSRKPDLSGSEQILNFFPEGIKYGKFSLTLGF